MAAVDDVDNMIERYHLAQGKFLEGNPQPLQELFSHREDVTLANPLGPAAKGIGPVARGWEQVSTTQQDAASRFSDGEIAGFENVAKHVSAELAYIVEVERYRAKVGGGEEVVPVALRVTSILRPEEGVWKVVHRHADPITTAQPAQSVIKE
jgi:ketosteroid isomerase-like protein